MEVKLFEVRDEGTFIPVMATNMNPPSLDEIGKWTISSLKICYRERYLLHHAGFADGRPPHAYPPGECDITLQSLHKGPSTYNAFDWARGEDGCHKSRTMFEAHKYIIEHWSELTSGDVIDVQFIIGETNKPKVSEQELV